MKNKPHILLLYTGGTIGMVKDFETGALSNFDFDKLLSFIPELRLLDCTINPVSFDKPIDSSNMKPAYWSRLAETIRDCYDDHDGFVILHGSDTMSYTASALSFMLENLAKPVIFTGSQLPIGDLRTDAKENLITSIQIAALQRNGRPEIAEVCLYFEYKLYRANRTTKINAEHFEAFASPNYPPLAESGVHLAIEREKLLPTNRRKKLSVQLSMESRVLLIKLFPGLEADTFHHLLNCPGLQGVVLETYGAGNATNERWFVQALKETLAKDIPVVNVTQCSGGSVSMGDYETSVKLKKMGILSGRDITTEAALAKLVYLLGQNIPSNRFKTIFETPLRGEMT